MKYFKINGIIECSDTETNDTFFDKLDDFCDKQNLTFGGGYVEVDADGKIIGEDNKIAIS